MSREVDPESGQMRMFLEELCSELCRFWYVEDEGGWCAPSETYLGHILRGLEAAGHPPASLDHVRSVAAREGT